MIKFFGCSYTEGGGLDNIDYYNFLHKENLEYYPKHLTDRDEIWQYRGSIQQKLEKFKLDNRFTELVNKEVNCVLNLAVSQSSNACIFEKLFTEIENNNNEMYFVILSLMHRRYWYYDYDGKKYNLNMADMNGDPFNNDEKYRPLHNHYLDYLKIVFNDEEETQNVLRNVKLFDAFAKVKGSKIIWSSWEMGDYQTGLDKLEKAAERIIKFDGLSMKHYCIKNGYQIHTETNNEVNDNHISLKGNQEIAKIFTNYIKENKLL